MEQEVSTTQTPAPAEAPKAKGKAGAIIITAIVAFALGIGAFFLINTLTNKSDDTDNPTGETVTAKSANDVIADAKELIRRTNLIFFLFDDESDQLSIYKTPRYSSLSELNELSLDAKATIARGTLVDDKFVTNWERSRHLQLLPSQPQFRHYANCRRIQKTLWRGTWSRKQ